MMLKFDCFLKGHNIIAEYTVWGKIQETKHYIKNTEYKGGYCNKCKRYIKHIRSWDKIG